jgi:hypothetical protein
MTAPHEHTTDEVKANIKRISHNTGCGDNGGPVGIHAHGSNSGANMTTSTKNVEPAYTDGDVVNKRPV